MLLLNHSLRKETPFCYIDTHAGTGYYDLFSEFAKKTKEYEGGIEKIIQQENPPPLMKRYLDCVHHINNKLTESKFASLRYYPGSPIDCALYHASLTIESLLVNYIRKNMRH